MAASHFDSPQAAMRYLARAYNRNDQVAMKKVTTPKARRELNAMRWIAPSMTLHRCEAKPGAYVCFFRHTYPEGYDLSEDNAWAEVHVAPAARSGWYMSRLLECS